MKDSEKPRKKKIYRKPEIKECPYCGGKNFERYPISHVGVVRICKNCREQID